MCVTIMALQPMCHWMFYVIYRYSKERRIFSTVVSERILNIQIGRTYFEVCVENYLLSLQGKNDLQNIQTCSKGYACIFSFWTIWKFKRTNLINEVLAFKDNINLLETTCFYYLIIYNLTMITIIKLITKCEI